MKKMSKKVILITGASSGFGKGTALELLKKDHIVYGAARRTEKMKDILKAGGKILKMDVTDNASIQEGVETIIKEHGKIDIVYVNAGYGIYGSTFDMTVEDVMAMYDVNVHGTHRVIRAVVPHMINKNKGRIIITESIVSNMSSPYAGWYASTKHALKAVSNALSAELKDFDIEVVSIRPGAVKTGFDSIALDTKNLPKPNKAIAKDHKGFVLYMEDLYKSCPDTSSTVKAMVQAGTSSKPKRIYNTTIDAKVTPFAQSLVGADRLGKVLTGTVQKRYKKFEKTGN